MSLNKSIEYGKEHRNPYIGCKSIDSSCRNHGSCKWCLENRLYKNKKRLDSLNSMLYENNNRSNDSKVNSSTYVKR